MKTVIKKTQQIIIEFLTAFRKLEVRQRMVLVERFGLLDGHPQSLEEVGRHYSVTRERIRQIESKALRKLGHPANFCPVNFIFDSADNNSSLPIENMGLSTKPPNQKEHARLHRLGKHLKKHIKLHCFFCNKIFFVRPFRIKHKVKFCSNSCFYKARIKYRSHSGMPVIK